MPRAYTPTPTPASTSTSPAVRPPRPPKEFPPQLPRNKLHVHEVTIPTTVTVVLFILPTRGFPKIRDRREIGNDGTPRIKPTLQSLQSGCGLILFLKLNIDVANHVISKVVTNVEAFNLAKLAEFLKEILEEILKVLLDLARVEGLAICIDTGGDHVGSLVHVGEEECWGDGRTVVETRAAVTVTASANLEVEGTVHSVLFGTKDRS